MTLENLENQSNDLSAGFPVAIPVAIPAVSQVGQTLEYVRNTLQVSDEFEIVSCEWTQDNVSLKHDHGWSQCRFLIQEGTFENTTYSAFSETTTRHTAGDVVVTYVGSKHEFKCVSKTGRTFHVYTPKLSGETKAEKFKVKSRIEVKEKINIGLSETGISLDELAVLSKAVQQESLPATSVYFMNQLFSGVLPEMLMAEETIARTRTTAATFEASPVFSTIEQEVIEKLGGLIGWSAAQVDGVAVPGGSAANFMALHCARQDYNPALKKTGLHSQGAFRIFVSNESHYSFKKATVALGFGTDSLIAIKTDENGKMIIAELEREILKAKLEGHVPLLACATAGTTVLGAFDPIDQMAEICKKHDMWLHVDGAWGGPVLFSDRKHNLLKGISKADSVAFDAHKLLGANLTCSFFLTNQKGLLFEANDVTGADYLFHENEANCDLGRQSWQCGRRPDAFSLWMIWKSAGTAGIAKFIERLYKVQEETVQWIKTQPRLELVAEPEFLNICVRVKPPTVDQDPRTWSSQVRDIMRAQNQAMVNYSSDKNGTFLRLILCHPSLETAHTKQILKWAIEAGAETSIEAGAETIKTLPVTGIDLHIT